MSARSQRARGSSLAAAAVVAAAALLGSAALASAGDVPTGLHRPVIIAPAASPALTGKLSELAAVLGKEPESAREPPAPKSSADDLDALEEDDMVFEDDVSMMGADNCSKLPSEGGRRLCRMTKAAAKKPAAAAAPDAAPAAAAPAAAPKCGDLTGAPEASGAGDDADLAEEIRRYEELERQCGVAGSDDGDAAVSGDGGGGGGGESTAGVHGVDSAAIAASRKKAQAAAEAVLADMRPQQNAEQIVKKARRELEQQYEAKKKR